MKYNPTGIGTKALGVKPDLAIVAQCLEARGISGVSPEVAAERFVRWIASSESLDSMGDVITAEGWDLAEWLENPVLLKDHKRGLEEMLGRGLAGRVSGKNLEIDTFFLPPELAPDAFVETCYKMVKAGIITDCSIGAIPTAMRYASDADKAKYGKETWRIWEAQTLKELSVVCIGANSRAKVSAFAKALSEKEFTDGDLMAIRDSGMEEVQGLAERAVFALHPKGFTLPTKGVPELPDFSEQVRQMKQLKADAEAAVRLHKSMLDLSRKSEAGLVIPLTLEDAEAILTYNDAIAETLRKYIPKSEDDEGGEEPEDLDPVPQDDGKSLGPEFQRLADAVKSFGSQPTK